MTVQEVKSELEKRGISLTDFAARLGISYSGARAILAGRSACTPQLLRHMELELALARVHQVGFTVSLPDGGTECHLHGADKLTEAERLQVLHCIYNYLGAELASRASSEADSAPRA